VSATQEHIHLQAVPTPQHIKWHMALLLRARYIARQAWDAARAVPAAAAAFVRRLLGAEQLRAPLAWLRRLGWRLGALVRPVTSRLGPDGLVTAVGLALTSSTVRGLLARVGRAVLSTATRVASTAGQLLDGALRRCGVPGTRLADVLSGWAAQARRSASECAAPLLRALARTSTATQALRSVLGAVARGYALHKVLRLLIHDRLLRAFVGAAIVPAFADGRLLAWVRDLAEQVQWQLWRLQRRAEQAPVSTTWEEVSKADEQVAERSESTAKASTTTSTPGTGEPEPPRPANRAERRAQQQRQARQRRNPQFA
jgi:hypothetical protein